MPYEEQFAALAHPLRQDVLDQLQSGPSTVRDLTIILETSQPVMSQHLKVLREAGLVVAVPQGTSRLYHIETAKLDSLRSFLKDHWHQNLEQLGRGPSNDA